ncbi:MAG TPA: biotin--[acetyl-CoA-carboxylase] ligase [Gemmatimonadaceae bacterium]|nr:biotin--[acetyl-CoA-carboxylase] ligase [Gemmatimonadaceae bacterium]
MAGGLVTAAAQYDGCDAAEIARRVGVPSAVLFMQVGSTLDVAHERAAAGAPAGTLVLADEQTAGRGRQGRNWVSESGSGIWMTLVERPADPAAVAVLSLRVGLHAAAALDAFSPGPVGLKWPNDLYVQGRKLAGILIEARWREAALDWIAIGFAINVQAPRGIDGVAALRAGTRRMDVLERLVPALRAAAAATGPLSADELGAFARRDVARGRRCREPVPGAVAGIDASGALLVSTGRGVEAVRAGSLVLEEDA